MLRSRSSLLSLYSLWVHWVTNVTAQVVLSHMSHNFLDEGWEERSFWLWWLPLFVRTHHCANVWPTALLNVTRKSLLSLLRLICHRRRDEPLWWEELTSKGKLLIEDARHITDDWSAPISHNIKLTVEENNPSRQQHTLMTLFPEQDNMYCHATKPAKEQSEECDTELKASTWP